MSGAIHHVGFLPQKLLELVGSIAKRRAINPGKIRAFKLGNLDLRHVFTDKFAKELVVAMNV